MSDGKARKTRLPGQETSLPGEMASSVFARNPMKK